MSTPVWRAPEPVGVGAQLGVREGEVVVLVDTGRAVGALGTGAHVLDPASQPFLHASPGPLEAVFVAVKDCGWIKVGGPAGMVRDADTGENVRLTFRGTYAVDLGDPIRVVSELALLGGDPGEAVEKWIGSLITRVATTGISEALVVNGVPAARLAEPDVAKWLAEGVARKVVEASAGLIEGLRFSEFAVAPLG